jgi:hypothetical protein
MQKYYFYETIKNEKMNDGIFVFSTSTVNISYGVFTRRKNYSMGTKNFTML